MTAATAERPASHRALDVEEAWAAAHPTPLDGALECAKLGLSVLPVHGIGMRNGKGYCRCGKRDCRNPGKHPRLAGWQAEATADPVQIHRWSVAFPGCNFGVIGLFFDADPRNGGTLKGLPPTNYLVRTGGGGWHAGYDPASLNGAPLPKALRRGLDIKGHGGFVVAPGGRHESGGTYSWVSRPAPGQLCMLPVTFLHRPERSEESGAGVRSHLADLLRSPAVEGERNTWLTQVAGHYAKAFAGRPDVYQVHVERANASLPEPLDAEEVARTAASIWAREQAKARPSGDQSSWLPVDLGPILAGGALDNPPAFLTRTDGARLLYPGRTHAFNGEPESLKTWAALAVCAERVRVGDSVLYVDFEDHPDAIVSRLLALGLDPAAILAQFRYIRPDGPLEGTHREVLSATLADVSPTLIVLDGVTEAMVAHGWDPSDNRDVARFIEAVPKTMVRSGAAVVQVDHVVKDAQTRGRFALGAQHKLAGIDGSAFTFHVVTPFGRGMHGTAWLELTKDRPGFVRQAALGKRAGELHLMSHPDGSVVAELRPAGPGGADDGFVPTVLMERVSDYLAREPGASGRDVEKNVRGKAAWVREALKQLIHGGYVERRAEGRNGYQHFSRRPYRVPQ